MPRCSTPSARASRIVRPFWGCLLTVCALVETRLAVAGDAPSWMHAQVDARLPVHDDAMNAVLLFSETVLTVQSNGQIKRVERRAYRILRPDGEGRGTVRVDFDSQTRITGLHAWCIPATGKDYEVKEKDAVESTLAGVENGELVSDLRTKLMRIPAATPGSIVCLPIVSGIARTRLRC
jgi:hypothetical protein